MLRNIIATISIMLVAQLSFAQQICRSNSEIPPSIPNERLVDHGNGTISDRQTNLMWLKCPVGLFGNQCTNGNVELHNWSSSLSLAEFAIYAGYNNWRVPNIKEFNSIIERQCYKPAMNLTFFPNTLGNSNFWLSTPSLGNAHHSWAINTLYGFTSPSNHRGNEHPVRLVRSK